jgi:hypothetical protein
LAVLADIVERQQGECEIVKAAERRAGEGHWRASGRSITGKGSFTHVSERRECWRDCSSRSTGLKSGATRRCSQRVEAARVQPECSQSVATNGDVVRLPF